MEVLEVEGVRIAGIAAFVPPGRVENDAKVAAATGIPARRVAPSGASVADLCLAAARRVIADASSRPDEFGAIVAVSFTQRERMPSVSAQAQARLGFPKGVLALDLMQACAGWPYGLYVASLLARETGKKVLLLDGDKRSDFLDANDAATSPLLSDGATATIVENEVEARGEGGEWKFAFLTDGGKGDALRLEKGSTIKMDGFGVFRFVATDVVAFLKEFAEKISQVSSPRLPNSDSSVLSAADIGFFVPHQPNVYMVRQLAKALGLSDCTLVSADRFGNLASASVPATIAAHADEIAGKGARVLASGFGGGLAASAASIVLPADCRLSVSEEEIG